MKYIRSKRALNPMQSMSVAFVGREKFIEVGIKAETRFTCQ